MQYTQEEQRLRTLKPGAGSKGDMVRLFRFMAVLGSLASSVHKSLNVSFFIKGLRFGVQGVSLLETDRVVFRKCIHH